MSVLREAITEAMRAKADESPAIKSTMDDVAEAVAAVKRDLIGELPKMRRAGRTDVSDLKDRLDGQGVRTLRISQDYSPSAGRRLVGEPQAG